MMQTKTKKRKNKKAVKTSPADLTTLKQDKKYKLEKTKEYVVIDHPKNKETIKSDHYSLRIGASPCQRVEVCLNRKDWMPCRYSVGYWWFDWMNFTPGTYKIKARALDGKGKPKVSKMTTIKID